MFSSKSVWIGCEASISSPIVLKEIDVHHFQKATIDICGLGYYELFVNGQRVSETYFKPVVSDYSARDFSTFLYPLNDETSHTIYYNTFDITKYLRVGKNTLAVMLGNGFYRQTRRICEGNTKFGDQLLLRFDLKLRDNEDMQHFYTDGSERTIEGFIKENNLFYGEVHDYANFGDTALLNPDSGTFMPVQIIPAPKAKIRKQICKNDTVRERMIPRIVNRTENSVIYDVGKNITGFVCLKPNSPIIRIRHAEELSNGELDFASAGGADQISENVYQNAQGFLVHPWFSWSGFRYFEVFGNAEVTEVLYICSDVKTTAQFRCGNDTINWLFETYLNTQLCNMHSGVPSDCPHRERLGYTGDGQLTAETAMLLLDSKAFYRKWIQDIADCQDIHSGHIQHTAPLFGGGGGPGGWGAAMVLVPYAYYKMYADTSILEKYYPNMLRYLACMKTFCENGLIVKERKDGWCLGDWCTPDTVKIPEPFINTFYYIRSMEIVQKIAGIIGKTIDFSTEIAYCKQAMTHAYWDASSGDFCQSIQGANVFGLLLGLGNQKTRNNLLDHYHKTRSFDTGIFGTDCLAEYLTENGDIQLLFDLLSAQKYPSFGYMQAQGATTLWENWNGAESHNHPMFGGCVKHMLYGFLGLRGDPGFQRISLQPQYIEGIGFIQVELKFPKGTLKVEYRYENGVVHPKVETTGKIQVTLSM